MLFQCEDLNELVYGFLTKDEVNYVLNKLQLISDLESFAVEHGIVALLKTCDLKTCEFGVVWLLYEKAMINSRLKILKILLRKTDQFWIRSIFYQAVKNNSLKIAKWYLKHYSLKSKIVSVRFQNLNQDMRQWLVKKRFILEDDFW